MSSACSFTTHELLRELLAIDAGLLQPGAEVGDAERGDGEDAELEDDAECRARCPARTMTSAK